MPLDAASSSSEDEEEVERVAIACELCRKTFRTEAQLSNHEGSKKHRQNVERLRKELVAEERRAARATAKAAKGASFEARAAEGAASGEDDEEEEGDEEEAAPIRRKETKKEKKKRLKQEAAQRRRMGSSDVGVSSGGTEDGDDALAASLDALLGVSPSSERPAAGGATAQRAVTLTAIPFVWLDQSNLCVWFRAVGLKVFALAVEERQPAPPSVGCAVWLSAAILASPHFDLNQLRQRQVGKKPQQRKLMKLVAEARSAGVALDLLGRVATAEEQARAVDAANEATAAAEVSAGEAPGSTGAKGGGGGDKTAPARRETKKEKRKRLKREAAARRARELEGADELEEESDEEGEEKSAATAPPSRGDNEGEIVTSTFVDAEEDDTGRAPVVGAPIRHRCETCRALFTSRSKLFAHIKQFGHASVRA